MTWNDDIWIEGLDNLTKIPSEGGTFSFLIYNGSDEDAIVYISNTGSLQISINSAYSISKNSFTVVHYTVQSNENTQLRNFSFSFRLSINGMVEDTINFIQLGHIDSGDDLGNFENIKYYPGISTYAPAGNIGTTGTSAVDFLTDNINEKNIFEKFPISETNDHAPSSSIYNMSKLLAQYTIYKVNNNLSPISFKLQTQLSSGIYMFVDKVTNESIIVRF